MPHQKLNVTSGSVEITLNHGAWGSSHAPTQSTAVAVGHKKCKELVLERTSHKPSGPHCKTSDPRRSFCLPNIDHVPWDLAYSWTCILLGSFISYLGLIYFLSLWVGSSFHGLFVLINPLESGWEACSLSPAEHSALNSVCEHLDVQMHAVPVL